MSIAMIAVVEAMDIIIDGLLFCCCFLDDCSSGLLLVLLVLISRIVHDLVLLRAAPQEVLIMILLT